LQRLRGRGDQEGRQGRAAGGPGGRLLPSVPRARPGRGAGRGRGGRVPAAAGAVRPVGRGLGAAPAEGHGVSAPAGAGPAGGAVSVVVEAPGEHRLAPHEPREPAPGEALVRVHATGICGSDRELYQGNRPEGSGRYPLTPGQEWSGTVERVGSGVPAALLGRKVVGEGFRNCQVCDRCHAGESTLCTAGYEETGFTEPGAMAPTLTLPARLLHVLPDDADLTAAALLEPAACIAAAALKARAVPGERVAVVGTGTLGMFAVQFLRAASPAELLVVGTRRDREDLAVRF